MKTNPYKDYITIEETLNDLQTRLPTKRNVVFLAVGEGGKSEVSVNLERRFIPYQKDIKALAKYYQAADIYLHAARAENFPNVILEALACGTLVIATNVGGIGEQIRDGETGYLVPPQGTRQMSNQVLALLKDPERVRKMSTLAAQDARERFSMKCMVDNYLDFYQTAFLDFLSHDQVV